jgi:hypothetical protein
MPKLPRPGSRIRESKINKTMPPRKTQKVSENEITRQIIEGLKLSGYRIFKVYNGGVFGGIRQGQAVFRKKPEEYRGVSDLIAINKKKKKLLFIEVKAKGNYASKEQLDFIDLVDGLESVRGIVAYDFGDLKKII